MARRATPSGRAADKNTHDVARYYDASTRRFLAVGGSGRSLAIHRLLWAEGITTREAAANHINTVVRDEAVLRLGQPPATLCDLGCGVGGSVLALARDWPATRATGITISETQVALAETEARARGLSDRCTFRCGDFTALTRGQSAGPTGMPPADLAIAVESHVHSPSAGAFLKAARRHLRPGGILLIVDDMLARPEAELTPRDKKRLQSFRRGWRLGHVPDIAGLIAEAEAKGFTHEGTQDLTPLIRLNRLRDIALRVAGPMAETFGLGGSPFFANMIGGNALTESYRHGVMRYTMVSLRVRDVAL